MSTAVIRRMAEGGGVGGPRRPAVVAGMLLLALLPSVIANAGERCESHFPELRLFVDIAGPRGNPDDSTSLLLLDELAIERALWADEVDHNRRKLAAVGATVGIERLEAIDREISGRLDSLEAALSSGSGLDEEAVLSLLACGGDDHGVPDWPIRSGAAITPEEPPTRREPLVTDQPPAGYHEPPDAATRAGVKADPGEVWPDDENDPVVAKAAELEHDPIAIYRFVLNEVGAEHYFGAVKPPAAVLRAGSGNDADQAALLAELLRASGYPARLAWGVVEVPLAPLLGHFGVGDAAALESLLTRAGVPWEPVTAGGVPTGYRLERFWCELWIPYANFRGVELDRSGETWAVLDPQLETVEEAGDRRVLAEMGFDPGVFLDDYLAGAYCAPDLTLPGACPTPRTVLADQVDQFLSGTGDSYESLSEPPAIVADTLPILPASMVGTIVSVRWVGLEYPNEAGHRLRLLARDGGAVLMDETVPVTDLAGSEAVLWYAPATPDDALIVQAYDNYLWNAPPYLVNVTPQLIVRGGELLRGSAGTGMGRPFDLEVSLTTAAGQVVGFVNGEMTGVPTALGIAAGSQGYEVLGDEPGSSVEVLSQLADDALGGTLRFVDELAVLEGLAVAHAMPSLAWVGNVVEPDGTLGLVQELVWQGLYLDADVWGARAAGGDAAARRGWRTLAHLEGSALERAVFEVHDVTSVSADLALILAEHGAIPIAMIDQGNLATILPTLPYEQHILAEIEAWVLAGGEARVPTLPLALLQWDGVGYLLSHPATGEARYQLAGALSGGSTTEPPEEIGQEFGLDLWPPTQWPTVTDPSKVQALHKVAADLTDFQEDVVGAELEYRLRVAATDHRGARVQGVPVLFSSAAGDGRLLDEQGNEHSTLQVPTNEQGEASVRFRLGYTTAANPSFVLREPFDDHLTQALLHLVDAEALIVDPNGGAVLDSFPTPEPFVAIGYPDEPFDLIRTNATIDPLEGDIAKWSDTIYMAVKDQYDNPVSNVPVTFEVEPMQMLDNCSNELPPDQRIEAAVFDNRVDALGNPPCNGNPVLGSCGGPTLAVTTSYKGASAGVIEGNVLAASYPVRVWAPYLGSSTYFYSHPWRHDQINDACSPLDEIRVSSSHFSDGEGNNISATHVGTPYLPGVTFWMEHYQPAERPGGDPPYYAGGGGWLPVCGTGDMSVTIPDSHGASITSVNLRPGDWAYEVGLIAGYDPWQYQIRVAGSAFTYCQTGIGLTVPLSAVVTHVWGIEPWVFQVVPDPIPLTEDGRLAQQVELHYYLTPDQYVAFTADVEVVDTTGGTSTVWLGSALKEVGVATLPRGLPMPPEHSHVAHVVVNRRSPVEVRSNGRPLPLHQPIFANVPRQIHVAQEVDVVNRSACPDFEVFSFHVNHDAIVSLGFESETQPGNPLMLLDGALLTEGDYSYTISPSAAAGADLALPPGNWDFVLHGVSQVDGHVEDVPGVAVSGLTVRDALPVGHAIVKGVDLFAGHVVVSREDLSIPGRGVPLRFERTYSSSSHGPGPLGPGWSHNWQARVVETKCGERIVVGTEGSGMRFVADGSGWRPLRGYHGSLVEDVNGNYDFYTTGGTRYHFVEISSLGGNPLGEWFLDFVEDPSGNRTSLVYEEGGAGVPRVKRVQDPAGRELVFGYEWRNFQYWGGDVLVGVEAPGDLELRLDYDGRGNLVLAGRESDARVEGYGYQLTAYRDVLTLVRNELNGAETRYAYDVRSIGMAGDPLDFWQAATVTEPEGGVTRFFYDEDALYDANATELRTWVRDPRSSNDQHPLIGGLDAFDTTYRLNRYGSPTAITDPLGHQTTMEWDFDHVVMTARTDANGVRTDFSYDEHANLLTETVSVTDVDGVPHDYVVENTYYPPSDFSPPYIKNRVASHTDRNGALTSFAYDGAGRLEEASITVHDAGGAAATLTTSHSYDPTNGDRLSTTDPRGTTTTFAYDGYGNLETATVEVTDHQGTTSTVVTTTHWDVLGRPTERIDPLGRVTSFEYDTLGRLTKTTHPEVEVDQGVYWAPVEELYYDDVANTATAVDGNGHANVSSFDLLGRLVRVDNPVGGSKVFDYDHAGNKISESSVFDDTTPRLDIVFSYDEAGRLTTRSEPLGRITIYDHDAVGNVTVETLHDSSDPQFEPRLIRYDYDELNRVKRTVRDPGSFAASTESLLDGEGNVVRSTDAEGRQTYHHYDEANRRIESSEPEWRQGSPKTTRFFYDGNGNLVRELRFNQLLDETGAWVDYDQQRWFDYDELDRLIVSTDAEGAQEKSKFDLAGNPIEEIDARGHRSSHVYDALNRRIQTTYHLTDPETGASWNVATRWVFDAVGNLRHEFWPNGNQVTNSYDAANRLSTVVDRIGSLISTTYDARGNRITETDGRGHTTVFTYDNLDRLVRVDMPEGRTVQQGYDAADNRVWLVDPKNQRTDFSYDVLNRLERVIEPELDGGTRYITSFAYDLVGNLRTQTDPRGNSTTLSYDDLNRVIEVVDPPLAGPPQQQYRVHLTYDALGNPVQLSDRRQIPSRWEHDRENRLTGAYRDGIRLVTVQYDSAGNAVYVTDAEGHTKHGVFDERDLVVRIEQPEDSVIRLTRDAMGNVIRVLDPELKETTRSFDYRRRLTTETSGEGETTSFGYDGNDNLTSVIRPKGEQWAWTRVYDDADRLEAVHDPMGHRTTYGYDLNDNLHTVTDAEGLVTTLSYDARNLVVRREYPDGSAWSFEYDGNGNRTYMTDPNGQAITSVYDELNRETLRSYSAPFHPISEVLQSIGFSWDPNSNLTEAIEIYNTLTRHTRQGFDSFDRLDWVTDGFGRSLDYGYDNNGNRTSLIDPDGGTTTYTYDGLNRLDRVFLPGDSGMADYDWYKNGLLRRVDYPNGTYGTYSYDDADRVLSIDNYGPGAVLLSSYGYSYDANGNRSSQQETNGGGLETTTYAYDFADRMWQVRYPEQTTTYVLDGVGNRETELSRATDGTVLVDRIYDYDNRNRLTSVTDNLDPLQTINYGYDLNGNQVRRTSGGATLDLRYDVRDQLLEVDSDGSQLSRFSYDYRGLRVTKWDLPGLLNYTYDDESVLQQHSAVGDVVATYRYGGDRLLAVDHFAQGRSFYHFDSMGSIANLTDAAGAAANRYSYDAWGNFRSTSGSLHNPFGFTGFEWDGDTGLYYAQARFYDPLVGRFLSEDPEFGQLTAPPSLHRYLYSYGNPTTYIDPDGRVALLRKLRDRFREASEGTRELTQMYAESEFGQTIVGRYIGVHVGLASGVVQGSAEIMGAAVSVVNTATNVAVLTVSGDSVLAIEAAEELEQSYESIKQVAKTVWEDPLGVGSQIAKSVGDTAVGVARGDPVAIGDTTKVALDIVVGTKGAGTVKSTLNATRRAVGRLASEAPTVIANGARTTAAAARRTGEAIKEGAEKVLSQANNARKRMQRARAAPKRQAPKLQPQPQQRMAGVCFVAGTLVHTSDGYRPIEEVQAGDTVLSWDETTGEASLGEVVRLFVTPEQPVIEVELETEDGDIETLGVTDEHPFRTKDGRWVAAGRLQPGDHIVTSRETWLRVRQVRAPPRRETVYNFEVAEAHTYFVGTTGALVHNSCYEPTAKPVRPGRTPPRGRGARSGGEILEGSRFDKLTPSRTPFGSRATRSGGELLESAGRGSAPVGASLRIPEPKILSRGGLNLAEEAALRRHLRSKVTALQSAARRGELRYSPGTESIRIPELQFKYRERVIERFRRRFGREPNLARLDADHPLDLIVGGPPSQRLKLLHRSINRSIGSSLKEAARRAGLHHGDLITDILID